MELKKQQFKSLWIYADKKQNNSICNYANKSCTGEMLLYRLTDSVPHCRSVVTKNGHECTMYRIHKQKVKQIPNEIFNYQLKTLVL